MSNTDLPPPGFADGSLQPPPRPVRPEPELHKLLGAGKFKAGVFNPPGP